ncbi:MAG: 3-oxoacyl-ACP synthase [Flavobacteriales bacterium]|nr:3-oxoacyl-ACP synthase [Flavobacteriales bacterium]
MDFKNKLVEKCLEILQERLNEALLAMTAAQNSANHEEKSSAGDKYETTRSMMQADRDMFARQVKDFKNEIARSKSIVNSSHTAVRPGSLVITDHAKYFIFSGIGKLYCEGEEIVALSPKAPLAMGLMGKKKDEDFILNGMSIRILEIN